MRFLPLLLAVFFAVAPCYALMAPPRVAPVDRLVATAEKFAKEHPETAEPIYTLARVHYLAFSTKRDQVVVQYFKDGEAVNAGSRSTGNMYRNYYPANAPNPVILEPAALFAHASAAKTNFELAAKMQPKNALYQLGLASLLDEARTLAASLKPAEVPPEWVDVKIADIRKAYGTAFDLALGKDQLVANRPMDGLEELVSYEAGKALVRLADADRGSLTAEERAQVERAKSALESFNKLPMGPITPIVLSMQPVRQMEELLAPELMVDFDLRGYGPRARWPWVKPELGFLVWDPLERGEIESARDLFGSYSFQIFRQTGYDALAALDDNGDGRLAGDELEGIRVWFDRNSDGISTAAEVVSLDTLGIVEIAVRETAREGRYPMNPAGITLGDGRRLPTWDWITEPQTGGATGRSIANEMRAAPVRSGSQRAASTQLRIAAPPLQ